MVFFFQAEDGIRDLVRSRGLGDVYKRQDPFARAFRMDKLALAALESTLALYADPARAVRELSLIHI